MTTISCYSRDGALLHGSAEPATVRLALASLGIEAGRWNLRAEPLSSTPQLTYSRELVALQRRFGVVLTDRHVAHARRPDPLAQEPDHPHRHDDRELRVVLQGRSRWWVPSGQDDGITAIDVQAGDWIALPPGMPHVCRLDRAGGLDLLRLFSRPRGWLAHPVAGVLSLQPQAEGALAALGLAA